MPESTITMLMFLMVFGVYYGRRRKGPRARWITPASAIGLGITGFFLGYSRSGVGVAAVVGIAVTGIGLYLAYQEAKRGGLGFR